MQIRDKHHVLVLVLVLVPVLVCESGHLQAQPELFVRCP